MIHTKKVKHFVWISNDYHMFRVLRVEVMFYPTCNVEIGVLVKTTTVFKLSQSFMWNFTAHE